MATRKKNTRRKKTIIEEKPKIQELGSFKLEDEVWFVKSDNRIIKGVINAFYPQDNVEPCVGLQGCFPASGYYVSPLRCCSFNKKDLKGISWKL